MFLIRPRAARILRRILEQHIVSWIMHNGQAFASGTLLHPSNNTDFLIAALNTAGHFQGFGLKGPEGEQVIATDLTFIPDGIKAVLLANRHKNGKTTQYTQIFSIAPLNFPGQPPQGYQWYHTPFDRCSAQKCQFGKPEWMEWNAWPNIIRKCLSYSSSDAAHEPTNYFA